MPSTFPNQIDNISLFLDINSSDGSLIKEFETYMANNDFLNASIVLNKIENVDQKIITATRMNQLRDCIIALEQFYGSDIESYISNKQNQWQSVVDQFKFIGTYSSSYQYKVNNIVSFQLNGEYLLYIRTYGDGISNKPPTDTNYWRVLTVKGERGISTDNSTTFYFDWISSQTYSVNSIVSRNNKWWIALKQNINSEPVEGSLDWQLVMSSMQAIYPIQSSQPLSQNVGELWFEVI